MIIGCICCLIQGALYPLIYYQVTQIVDAMDDSRDESGDFDESEYYDKTVVVIYIMIGAGLIAMLSAYMGSLCLSKVSINQANAFREAYFSCLIKKS